MGGRAGGRTGLAEGQRGRLPLRRLARPTSSLTSDLWPLRSALIDCAARTPPRVPVGRRVRAPCSERAACLYTCACCRREHVCACVCVRVLPAGTGGQGDGRTDGLAEGARARESGVGSWDDGWPACVRACVRVCVRGITAASAMRDAARQAGKTSEGQDRPGQARTRQDRIG